MGDADVELEPTRRNPRSQEHRGDVLTPPAPGDLGATQTHAARSHDHAAARLGILREQIPQRDGVGEGSVVEDKEGRCPVEGPERWGVDRRIDAVDVPEHPGTRQHLRETSHEGWIGHRVDHDDVVDGPGMGRRDDHQDRRHQDGAATEGDQERQQHAQQACRRP